MGKFILSFKRKGTIPPVTPDQPETPSGSDLVSLGILTKPIAEFSNSDIGTTVLIPYNDPTGKILLNNGNIEFEVVGVNHHTTAEHSHTITLMTKNIIRKAVFDAAEPTNPLTDPIWGGESRAYDGNNRWSVSNIRQWLNSSGEAGKWFTKQHDYDEPPTSDYIYDLNGAYAGDPGFLAGFSDEVIQHFTDITNTTLLHELDRVGSETSETTVDKVFLPSYTEMGFGDNHGIAEGAPLFTDVDSIGSKGTQFDDCKEYWLRSNSSDEASNTYSISLSGGRDGLNNKPSHLGFVGIAPIIVLH